MSRALLLRARSVAVADAPRASHALSDWAQHARRFEPFIAAGFSDREAWEALFTDEERLVRFRAVHGNRRGPRPRRQLPNLFDVTGENVA